MVPLAGIEPALLAELDFESSASTNSATGAFETLAGRRGLRSRRNIAGIACRSTRSRRSGPKARMPVVGMAARGACKFHGDPNVLRIDRLRRAACQAKHSSVIAHCLDSARRTR
jgi:hypothetical protein